MKKSFKALLLLLTSSALLVFCFQNCSGGLHTSGSDAGGTGGADKIFSGRLQKIAAGATHSCVIKESSLYCWGTNDQNQLGDGTFLERESPTDILTL